MLEFQESPTEAYYFEQIILISSSNYAFIFSIICSDSSDSDDEYLDTCICSIM